MNKLFQYIQRKGPWLLPGFPLFYFLVAVYFRNLLGAISLRSVDPDYIYFISGLGIAEGHLKIGHIDNPGTPLQYVVALVFRITYIFHKKDIPFLDDVFLHPDLYLSMVNLAITGFIVFAMFFAGKYVFSKTGSILYALLIQTVPLLPVIWYDLIGRVTPELLFPLPLFAISVLLIKYLYEENPEFKFRDLALWGFVFAFGMTIKLSFISLWIIPLILIKGWKKKLQFSGLGMLFFFLIAIPVTLQLNVFWVWVKNLFLHSGSYGQGEENIIDFSVFSGRLKELISLEHTFVWLFLGLLLLTLVCLLFFREKVGKWKGTRLSVAILAVVVVQFILTGKLYAHRYFIPVLMLAPILVILSAELVKKAVQSRWLVYTINVLLVLYLGWNFNRQFDYIRMKSDAIGGQVSAREATWHVASTLESNSIKIIVSQDYGCPFKQYALLYSTAWAANKLKSYYWENLRRLYPNTYQYTTWDDKFQHWGDQFDPGEVLTKELPVYIYLEKDSEDLYNKTVAKLDPRQEYVFSKKVLFVNPENGEAIDQLIFSKKTLTQ